MKTLHEEDLEKILKQSLKDTATKMIDKDYILKNVTKDKFKKTYDGIVNQKIKIEKELENFCDIQLNLYKDKASNIIDTKTFIMLSDKIKKDKLNLEKKLETVEQDIKNLKNNNMNSTVIESALNDFLTFQELDKVTLSNLLDKIVIYNDGIKCYLDIFFKFNDKSIKIFPK